MPDYLVWDFGEPVVESVAIVTHNLSADATIRYRRVDIPDEANRDGYVEVGRLFVGPAFDTDWPDLSNE